MMLKSVERLLEFVGDMNATEINDHIKACPDGFAVSFHIDNEWLDGWNRAVLATIEKIEKEVSERCMLLPLDADGVPIRVGDVMENIVCPSAHREVTGVGVECFYGWDEGNGRYSRFASCYRHHHKPTVEDVLTEFSERCDQIPNTDEGHAEYLALLAEYAPKFRLAGDEHDR